MSSASRAFKLADVSKWIRSGWSLVFGALGICWLLFFRAVSGEWQTNPQYSYGYAVPLLAAVLFWRRWPQRPVAAGSYSRSSACVAASLLFVLLPWMLAAEANPEWRLLYWVSGLQMLGLTFCVLHAMGGWKWVSYFAPPLLFVLISAPWPVGVEQAIVQNLMRWIAGLTVDVSDFLGIPAVQHGNVIEVGAGLVGIDEACSGVRSLQSALMLSLFLGEMHLLSWRRRVALVITSFLLVVVANLTRTSFLVWTAANHGLQQMEHLHDKAGLIVMWVVLPGLLGLGHLMKPKSLSGPAVRQAHSPVSGIPRWVGMAAIAWIATCAVVTEVWFRSHESALVANPRWTIAWPTNDLGFRKTGVPERSLAILRCSDSEAGSWRDDQGNGWSAFLLRWEPGKNSAQLAKGHRPDICFPAAGARLVEDFGQTAIQIRGVELPFRHQSFEAGGAMVHVFYCLWSDRRALVERALHEDGSQESRLEAVLAGKRHLGQQVFEVTVRGPDSGDDAERLLRQTVPQLIEFH